MANNQRKQPPQPAPLAKVPVGGWKTKTAGVGMILSGAGSVVTSVSFDPLTINPEQFQAGVALMGTGLGIIGIGHKVEKALN